MCIDIVCVCVCETKSEGEGGKMGEVKVAGYGYGVRSMRNILYTNRDNWGVSSLQTCARTSFKPRNVYILNSRRHLK